MTTVIVAATAGCSGNENDTDGGGNGGNGGETGDDTDGECEQDVLVDTTETVAAGDALTYAFELNEGWTLDMIIESLGEGARPTVHLEDPEGTLVLEEGPAELIYELVEIGSSGEHTLRIRNEDLEASGEFDVRVDHVSPAC
ncbi:MAG: hypothetical protein ACQET5_07420 [Halobacteriota archaeon]